MGESVKKKKEYFDRLGRKLKLGDQFVYMTGGKDGKKANNHIAQVVAQDPDGKLYASKIKSSIYLDDGEEFVDELANGDIGIVRKTFEITRGKGGIIILDRIDEDDDLPNAKIW